MLGALGIKQPRSLRAIKKKSLQLLALKMLTLGALWVLNKQLSPREGGERRDEVWHISVQTIRVHHGLQIGENGNSGKTMRRTDGMHAFAQIFTDKRKKTHGTPETRQSPLTVASRGKTVRPGIRPSPGWRLMRKKIKQSQNVLGTELARLQKTLSQLFRILARRTKAAETRLRLERRR